MRNCLTCSPYKGSRKGEGGKSEGHARKGSVYIERQKRSAQNNGEIIWRIMQNHWFADTYRKKKIRQKRGGEPFYLSETELCP